MLAGGNPEEAPTGEYPDAECAVHTSQFLLAPLLPDDPERRVTHSTNALAEAARPVEVRLQAELQGAARRGRDFRLDRRRRRTMTRCGGIRRVGVMHRTSRSVGRCRQLVHAPRGGAAVL